MSGGLADGVAPAVGATPAPADGAHRDVSAIARGGLASLIGAVVSAAANFGLVLVVARWDGQHAAGVFFGVTSLFLVAEALFRLGGDVGAVYFVARWRALGQPERIGAGLTAAFLPVVGVCVLATAVLLVLAPQVAQLIGDDSGSSVGLLRLLAVLLPLATAYDIALGVTRGLGTMRPTVVIEKILRPALQVVLIVIVLAVGWHAAVGAAWGLPYVVAAAAGLWALRAGLGGIGRLRRGDAAAVRAAGREFWRFTLPRAVASVAQILLQRLDIVLVAALLGARDAAIYTAATRFLVLGQFISQAIAAPVQPRLSAALANDDTPRARNLYRVSTCWIVLISWPVFATVAIFAPLYLGLFGSDYSSGVWVVVVLACSMLVAAAVGVVDAVVIMAGRSSWNLATTLAALAVNVIIDVTLIPSIGIIGAAIGWCAAIVAANLVPLALAWRGLGLHPFGPTVLAACALTAVCFGVLPLAGRTVSTAGAAVGLAIGIVGYLVAVWHWRHRFELTAFLRARRRPAGSMGIA